MDGVTDELTEPIRNFQGRYRFLSNFFPTLVEFDNMMYPTAEHAF